MQIEADLEPIVFKKFKVNHDRCSTQVSTDSIVLGAWADCKGAKQILDVGTGSGIVALMLAQRNAKANIVGVEIESETASQAQENVSSSPFLDRVSIEHSDIQSYARKTEEKFDLIVCNPPFFSGGSLTSSSSRLAMRSTKKLPHGDLLSAFRTLLSETGQGVVVLPYIEGLRFSELARSYGLYPVRILQLRQGPENSTIERLVIQLERKRMEPIRHDLVMKYETGEPSRQYKKLTKAFITDL